MKLKERERVVVKCLDFATLATWNPATSDEPRARSPPKPHVCMCAKLLQSCPTLWNLMGSRSPGSSVHGILQARTLEWVVMPSSGGSSRPRDQTCLSCISCTGRQTHQCTTWEILSFFKWKTVIVRVTSLYYCEGDVWWYIQNLHYGAWHTQDVNKR